MMGTALVMPTNDWKMLMPRTAASLQRAFRKPKAVHLQTGRQEDREKHREHVLTIVISYFILIRPQCVFEEDFTTFLLLKPLCCQMDKYTERN